MKTHGERGHLATAALLTVTQALSGCASGPSARPTTTPSGGTSRARVNSTQFPSQAELARITTAAPARPAAPIVTAPLERWELTGPFPDMLGAPPSQDRSPMAQLLRTRAEPTGGRAVVTDAMLCAARELARYMARHEGQPPQPIIEFVTGRCGAQNATLSLSAARGHAHGNATEATLVRELESSIGRVLDGVLTPMTGPGNVGAALVREGDHFVCLALSERRLVTLEPSPLTPDAQGAVTFTGRLLTTTAELSGYINQGASSSVRCEADASLRLPAFRLRCPMRAGDAVARVDVSTTAPGRLLGFPVMSVVVGPGRAAARTFELPSEDAASEVREPQQAQAAVLGMLNEARRAAGMPEVTLAAQESAEVCRLAPAYFANALDPATASDNDRIALGLMAGWSVQGGLIQEGRFFSGAGLVDNSAARWFRWALERPAGRRVLMDPAVRQVALCPTLVDGRFSGMLWSSYAFFDDAQIPAEEERVYALIDAQRAAAHQTPARRHAELRPLMATAAAVATRDDQIEGALNAMLDQASASIEGGAVQGWAVPTSDITSVTFAPDLISASDASVAVHVVHRRGEGAAWGQAVVYVLKH